MKAILKPALLAGLAAVAFGTMGAAAQGAGNEMLEEIIVTAQRRAENLQEVPMSVAAIGGAELRDLLAGGGDILNLSAKVPGLYAETSTGRIFPRFYIRGLGNNDFYLGASQPVSVIIDDVVMEHVVLKSSPLFDVRQVEVLRGPQGSLFGRNTTAGIIKFDSIAPSQETSGRATLTYGSYNTSSLDAGVGGALIEDILSVRASVMYQHRDDYVTNTYNGRKLGGYEEFAGRLQFLLTPSDNTSALLNVHGRDLDATSSLFRGNALTKGSNELNSNYQKRRVSYNDGDGNPQAYKGWGSSLKIDHDFGGVVLTSITAYETTNGYSRGDTDGLPLNAAESQGNVDDLDQWTQEIRLASDTDSAFNWQVGGFYFNAKDETSFRPYRFFETGGASGYVTLGNKNDSWAVFGQGGYQVTPELKLTAGARYTEDNKEMNVLRALTAGTFRSIENGSAQVQTAYTGTRHVELSDDKVSWDASAFYNLTDDASVFVRLASGFRGPTIQGRTVSFNGPPTTATSETIMSYEAGVKSSLFDNRLRLNGAVYTYSVDDIQLTAFDANGTARLLNAKKGDAVGFELDAELAVTQELTLTAGVTYTDTKIKDKSVSTSVCSPVTVCTVLDPMVSGRALIDGNPFPNAPKYILNFTARYDYPLANGGTLLAFTDWNVTGKTNFVLYESAEFYSKNDFEGGLRLGYRAPDNAYELAAFVRNITDEANVKGVIENFMAPVVSEPRTFGISLSAKL
ncbi:TonB-dependent receptor [Niveispirillum sp. BGYR6]|uniref:TonB-dependent receptor n=1 Tax=Niveispirillum sp. BGYR6 TaxID=2971249 RepID=UPI0022B99775|nr:TonB-dependent receptor [Niveispirillum sp. BGYR6]MDG5495446.1 TonB-dependent receptor [Niveispirillum sp. BGYR6]